MAPVVKGLLVDSSLVNALERSPSEALHDLERDVLFHCKLNKSPYMHIKIGTIDVYNSNQSFDFNLSFSSTY